MGQIKNKKYQAQLLIFQMRNVFLDVKVSPRNQE